MMETNQPCEAQERVFHKDPEKRSMENLSAMPDKTNVSYSTNVGTHYDSEGLEKFPEADHEEAGRGNGKDIREEMEARESTVESQPWRPDGTKEAWRARGGDRGELESPCSIYKEQLGLAPLP